ncbi:MAG TPA: hypothetical protein VL463_35015 [Kofleriaceae bacterium]|nr:hypothetical protein [Kofleriaceae bacterium]
MKRAWIVLSLLTACGTNEGPPDARVIDGKPPGGTLSMTWTLHEGASALACSDVGAQVVTVTIVPDNAGFGFIDTFSCTSLMGTTRSLDPGKYTLTVDLTGAAGSLVTTTTKFMHVDVASGQDTPLGAVDFMVLARGGIAIKLAANGQSANCTAGGANIDAMTLQLQDSQGTCIPATFMIAAGANNGASTYTSDCNSLPAGPCIEKDQTITATGLKSGAVQLVSTGDVGGKDCWKGSNSLNVPANDATKDFGTGLLIHQDALCP